MNPSKVAASDARIGGFYRRSLVVEITPAGLEVVQQVRTIIHRNETAWMSVLSDAELRTYIDLLHRIQDGLTASTEG